MNAEERMTKRTIRRRNPTFSEDLSGDPSFPRLEIYQISMKNGEKSMRGRDAIIIGNGKPPCDNCVAMRAATTKEEKGKLEIVNGKIYQVIARYIEVDEKPYVLELIRCLDGDWSIGEINHERLIDMFVSLQ